MKDGARSARVTDSLALWGALLGVLAACPALAYLWGFTVDDALIPARYATHVARGLGYRFNPHGPSTDGVTPLGWAYLLAPFAARGPLAALAAARAIGAIAWLTAAAALGASVARIGGAPFRFASLALVLASPALGAWACAGLETGLVMALSTAAAVLPAQPRFSLWGAALAGACAWLRPEMIAYAAVLGAGRAVVSHRGARRAAAGLVAVIPWCLAAAIRLAVWGRPAPLAVLSKPSDLAHGLAYVGWAIVFSGAPIVVAGPLALRRLAFWPRVLVAAAAAHLVSAAFVGGDWMPLTRLVCPVLPPLTLAAAHLLADTRGALFARARLVAGCAGEIAAFALRGPSAARVLGDRLALIDAARPVLARANRVATVDVGWVGAACDADIVDLAGATDPEIAALPGGHTSKAISGALLTGRRPDLLVFEMAPFEGPASPRTAFARAVEASVYADPLVAKSYRIVWRSPDTLPIRYAILSSFEGGDPSSDHPASD